MSDRITEIESFLQHKDYSLAVRRMLDLAFDNGEEAIMHSAIRWSRLYRALGKQETVATEPSFLEQAATLLHKLKEGGKEFHFRKEALLQASSISKSYAGSRFVLQPITLKVLSGDVIGIVGENGNGKTTLLRSLAGKLALDGGEIQYRTLHRPDHYKIKHHLAFIPQRIPRWYGQLKDNLHFSAAIANMHGRENEIMVDFMLERMNLSDYAHLNWNQVSSGYRTRFEIARVLLQKPRLMLLDEPLANLDILAQQTILTDLRYMAKSVRHPMGILLSSQQLHEVEKIADTVLFIKNGECLFRTGEISATLENILEMETESGRDELEKIFLGTDVQIRFNGGNYTISSSELSVADMLGRITAGRVPVSYFRDITHSTKRFF